jgi:hypothetical protein
MDACKKSILGYQVSDTRSTGPCILAMRMAFDRRLQTLHLYMTFITVIIINIFMRCTTFRTLNFLRNRLTVPSLDGFYCLIIFMFVIS